MGPRRGPHANKEDALELRAGQKHFVLDTNVLLHDPLGMFQFADNIVVIPIVVLEEVDQFKKSSPTAAAAREVCRRLDELREQGHLADGVPLKHGGLLKVAIATADLPTTLSNVRPGHSADNMILATALRVRDSNPGVPTILVTKGRQPAHSRRCLWGLSAVDYDVERITIEELYSGSAEGDDRQRDHQHVLPRRTRRAGGVKAAASDYRVSSS